MQSLPFLRRSACTGTLRAPLAIRPCRPRQTFASASTAAGLNFRFLTLGSPLVGFGRSKNSRQQPLRPSRRCASPPEESLAPPPCSREKRGAHFQLLSSASVFSPKKASSNHWRPCYLPALRLSTFANTKRPPAETGGLSLSTVFCRLPAVLSTCLPCRRRGRPSVQPTSAPASRQPVLR